MEYGVYGDLIIIYSKPYSIYLRGGTIGLAVWEDNGVGDPRGCTLTTRHSILSTYYDPFRLLAAIKVVGVLILANLILRPVFYLP